MGGSGQLPRKRLHFLKTITDPNEWRICFLSTFHSFWQNDEAVGSNCHTWKILSRICSLNCYNLLKVGGASFFRMKSSLAKREQTEMNKIRILKEWYRKLVGKDETAQRQKRNSKTIKINGFFWITYHLIWFRGKTRYTSSIEAYYWWAHESKNRLRLKEMINLMLL